LVGLQWGDIDWHSKTLIISRAVVGKNIGEVKTQRSGKPLPIAEEMFSVFESLRRCATCADDGEWIFPSSRNAGRKPWNAYALQRYQITPAAIRAGLGEGIGWHTLRHSYRSWLDRLGAPIGVQRDLMRHTDIRTTMNTYGGAFIDNMREAQGNVAKMLLQ
jgi:integrase